MSNPRKTLGEEHSGTREGEPGHSMSPDIEQILHERTTELNGEIEAFKREIREYKQKEADRADIENYLKETEDKFSRIIESLHDGIILNNETGVILEWNKGMEEIFGLQREEVIGRTLPEIALRFAPQGKKTDEMKGWVRSTIEEMNSKATSSSRYPFIEISIIRPDGTIRFIEAKNFSFTSGRQVFYGAIVRDITQRRKAEETLVEKEEELENLIESSGDGIIITDEEGRITRWNRGAEVITGLTARDVLGVPAWEVQALHSNEELARKNPAEYYRTAWDHILHDESDQRFKGLFVGKIRTVNKEVRYIQQRVFRIPTRSGFRMGAIIRDITEQRKAEEAFIEHEEELQNLIDSSGDGIIITDEEGRITRWNQAQELLTGLAAKDVLGLPVWEIQASRSPDQLHRPDPFTWYRDTWDILLHDETHPIFRGVIDDQLINGNGEVLEVQVRAFRIPTRKGFRIGAIVRDVTPQKQMEKAILESEERYRTLVEMSPDVIVIHQEEKIVFVNPAVKKLLRTTTKPEDLIGMDIFNLIHPDFHSTVKKGTQNDLNGLPPATIEIQVVRGDGTVVTLEGRGTRILYNKKPAVQVVIRDITERKSAELQLKEYTDSLKRSNEDLELFAYIATHDLQEPIRGIVAYSQLLLAECKAEHSSQTKKYLENISRDGLRLNSLVSDLREYLRVRSGAKPFAPTDMEEIFSNTLKTLHREIRETQASITHDPLPVVYADSAQITQVMLNLLSNAVKFHKKGVIPEIHVSACLHDGIWQFAVSDNGIGIPSEYHNKVFVLFERLHQRDTYPGTGLGLALCRRIIERHGGQMWVESATGNGSTFNFTLPVEPHEMVV